MFNSHNNSIFTDRQSRLAHALLKAEINALVLNPGPSLIYFTGLHYHLSERPVIAIFKPDHPVTLVTPELEATKSANLPFPTSVFLYGEDPHTWPSVFKKAAAEAGLSGKIGVEPSRLRFLELKLLESAISSSGYISAENSIAELRMQKDDSELNAMRNAVDIAQRALENVLSLIRVGMTERDLANELLIHLLLAGAHPEAPFAPIVSSGPNSANPHATPSDRCLAPGDLLVIDWGAYYQGYCSDLTRTFAVGDVETEYTKIAEIVLRANAAGREAGKPGIPASSVDEAARSVIVSTGYGPFFTHRTGHGLGLEGHEFPYIRAGNSMVLKPGMTYTVEPGIYLPNRGGVRIEDDMVLTSNGAESLSTLPRELRKVG
jgi:Xaa-Pro dipeptidase